MNIQRSSGILLHITSLPGNYGIGTLGDEAYDFVNKMKRAGLKYWQILPFGPVNPALGFSPYSSASTFAGNYMFISLEKLKRDFLPTLVIDTHEFEASHFVPFDEVIAHKKGILKTAFEMFIKKPAKPKLAEYKAFCMEHTYWLDDFAVFGGDNNEF